jgi:hypothetical protein
MSRAESLDIFATFPGRLRVATLAAVAPIAPAEWSAIEVIRHLIAVEGQVHLSRLRQIAAEDDPHWPWTEPGLAPGFDGAELSEVLETFAAARAATVELVLALDDDGWTRHGTHATYGRLDVDGLLRVASDHDGEHLRGLGALAPA